MNEKPQVPASTIPTVDEFQRNHLLEEYKIIQGKIDKSAEFQYKVRGWSVTVTAAILAAAQTDKIPWWCSIVGFLPVVLFAVNEHNQTCIGDALGDRAVDIEKELANLVRKESPQDTREQFSELKLGRTLRNVVNSNRKHLFGSGNIGARSVGARSMAV